MRKRQSRPPIRETRDDENDKETDLWGDIEEHLLQRVLDENQKLRRWKHFG